MNIIKHLEYFFPEEHVTSRVHVIGVGAIGSTVCELLARLGVTDISIYDFDTVEDYNVCNQTFTTEQVGMPKVEAVYNTCKTINPEIEITMYPKGYIRQPLNGYVFLCVDSIDLRKQIVTNNKYNNNIKCFVDFRMRLEDAQSFFAHTPEGIERLLATMDFTDEEAKAATPTSACGTSLSLRPTVTTIVSAGVCNWMNFCRGEEVFKTILINPYKGIFDYFKEA